MRITAAGAGTGYLSYKARQFIDRNLFDKPEEIGDDEKETLEELFSYWGTSGAFGNISDMARLRPGTWTGMLKEGSKKDYAKAVGDLVGSIYFAITPLLASDIHGLPGNYAKPGWLKIFKDLLEKSVAEGIPEAWQQEKYTVMRQISPLLSSYAQGAKAKEEARKKTIQAMIKARSKK